MHPNLQSTNTHAAQKLNDISGTPTWEKNQTLHRIHCATITIDILTRRVSFKSNKRLPIRASSSYSYRKLNYHQKNTLAALTSKNFLINEVVSVHIWSSYPKLTPFERKVSVQSQRANSINYRILTVSK